MKPVIGFIGIGNMGAPMAQNLLKAEYPLVVYARKEKVMEDMAKLGAEKAYSPREVASRSSVVITMLPASPDVESVVLGPDGITEGAKPGSVLIDMSSSYPASTRMIWEKLSAKGISMLDAPVSGGTKGAREKTLAIMVGGAEKDYNDCHPIFEAMGKNIYYVGDIGAGHTVKALNNLLIAGTLVMTSEALIVATKLGLSPEKVVDIINNSSGRSWSSQFKFPNYILNNAFNSGFSIRLLNKDVDMAVRLGREMNFPMYTGVMVQQIYNQAIGQGMGEDCHAAIIKLMEDWAGVEVRKK
jgi:3-hydroxyisobutyrate dehydrogenase